MIPSKMQKDEVASRTLVIITSSFSSIVSEYLKSFSTFYFLSAPIIKFRWGNQQKKIECGERTFPEVKLIITSVIKSGMEMDQLNMLSLAFEIRTDVAAKWSVNALFLGYSLIFCWFLPKGDWDVTKPRP